MPDVFDIFEGNGRPQPGVTFSGPVTDPFERIDQLVGNPDYLDNRVPQEHRVNSLLRQHAQRHSTWEDVGQDVQRYFPNIQTEQAKNAYTQIHRQVSQREMIDEAKREQAQRPGEQTKQTARRFAAAIPGVGSILPIAEDVALSRARARMANGTETHDDYDLVARRELNDEARGRRAELNPLLSKIEDASASGLRILGEMVAGGFLVKAAAAGLGIEIVAQSAPVISATGGLSLNAAASQTASMGGRYAVRQAAMLAATPGMWAPEWTRENVENGRSAFDFHGLPPALARGYAQMLILGSLGEPIGAVGGAGLKGIAARTALRGVAFPLEQQAADLVNYALGMQTGYGTWEQFAKGHKKSALQDLFIQALTGIAFGTIHENGGHEAAPEAKEAVKHLTDVVKQAHEAGVPAEKVKDYVQSEIEKMVDSLVQQEPQKEPAPNEKSVAQQPPEVTPTVQTSPEARPGAETTAVGQVAPEAVKWQSGTNVGNVKAETAGWKLHLATDKPEEVSKILQESGLKHKVGRSGQDGKDVTVYVGSKEAAKEATRLIEEKAGHLLKEPHGPEVLNDDVPFGKKVMGRFDIGSIDPEFHQYGEKGVPWLNADMDPYNRHPGATERADAKLKEKYGEFYTGKLEAPIAPEAVPAVESRTTSPDEAAAAVESLRSKGMPEPIARERVAKVVAKATEPLMADEIAKRAAVSPGLGVERPAEPTVTSKEEADTAVQRLRAEKRMRKADAESRVQTIVAETKEPLTADQIFEKAQIAPGLAAKPVEGFRFTEKPSPIEGRALRQTAQELGMSQGGSWQTIQERILKHPKGQGALNRIGEKVKLEQAMEQMWIEDTAGESPHELVQALSDVGDKVHPSEKSALEKYSAGMSLRDIADMREENGKPTVPNAKTGNPVSHETVRSYAEKAFKKLKENGYFIEYPTFGDYELEMETKRTDNYAKVVGSEPVTRLDTDAIIEHLDNVDRLAKEAEVRKQEYESTLKRGARRNGLTNQEVQGDIEKASADDIAAYRSKQGRVKPKVAPPEPQGQATRTPEPGAADQGADRGTPPLGPSEPVSPAPTVGGTTPGLGRIANVEPMPPVEHRTVGGTFGGGPLIATGTDKVAAAKNEQVQRNREAEGLAEIETRAGHAYKEDWEKARQIIATDPSAPRRLAEEVVKSNGERSPNRTETATLLHRHVSIRNEVSTLIKKLNNEAMDLSDRAIKSINNRIADLKIERDLIDKALNLGGSEIGGALGIRRAFVKFDYSYLGILDQAQAANPKKPLTPEETKTIQALSIEIEKLQKQLEEARGAHDASGEGVGSPTDVAHDEIKTRTKAGQQKADRLISARQWEAMTYAEKAWDVLKRLRIASFISSPITHGKVAASSLGQIAERPALEMVGSILRQLPGIKTIAEKAPVEGSGFSAKVEANALKQAGSKGLKDALESLRTGSSELDLRYGSEYDNGAPFLYTDYIGWSHGALKAPAVRAAYEQTVSNLVKSERAAGRDVTSTAALEKIKQQAYDRAIAERFQNDNAATKAFEKIKNDLKRSESSGANALGQALEFALPITKTPTNIIINALEHVLGLPLGIGRAGLQHAVGIEGLTKPQAEGIMRQLKRGTLGIPLMMLGFYLKDQIGGFYTKRREDELHPGQIQTPVGNIPSWLAAHHPALMALQFGASMGRAADQYKHGERTGVPAAFGQAMLGLLEEVPFVREQTEIARFDLGRQVRSLAIPAFFQWLAKGTDDQDWLGTNPNRVQRRPQGVAEQIEMGIPGLRRSVQRH